MIEPVCRSWLPMLLASYFVVAFQCASQAQTENPLDLHDGVRVFSLLPDGTVVRDHLTGAPSFNGWLAPEPRGLLLHPSMRAGTSLADASHSLLQFEWFGLPPDPDESVTMPYSNSVLPFAQFQSTGHAAKPPTQGPSSDVFTDNNAAGFSKFGNFAAVAPEPGIFALLASALCVMLIRRRR
ncbi:MAG: hypothetical protein ACR2NP_17505 [Pirellulaceae bacterium]